MVIADTQEHADKMAKAVNIKYESLGKPILSIQDAMKANSFHPSTNIVSIGNADGTKPASNHG